MGQTEKELMSVEQFLDIYGISRSRFFTEMKNKRLNPTRIGKRIFIRRAEADAWLDKIERGN